MSGRKAAGKDSLSRFACDWYASQQYNLIHDTDGEWREDYWKCSEEKQEEIRDEFTMECRFADKLKEFCIDTLCVPRLHYYGSDAEKNAPTQYQWGDASPFFRWKFGSREIKYGHPGIHEFVKHYRDEHDTEKLRKIYYEALREDQSRGERAGPMSGRDIMQVFGTELIRETFGNVWSKATIRKIINAGKPWTVITDNRFPDEIDAVLKEQHGYIIRLTRSPFGVRDRHPSESALDDYDWDRDRCFVLDNAKMNTEEQSQAIVPILNQILKRSENV